MTRPELQNFLIGLAGAGREAMIKSGGCWPQRAIVMDRDYNVHQLVLKEEPLHGRAMAELLRQFVRHLGGAELIAVQADARMKITTPEEWAAKPDNYSIAADDSNPECLITSGRSREHTALVVCQYNRTEGAGKDIIVFHQPEPQIDERVEKLNLIMIPNIWQHVN